MSGATANLAGLVNLSGNHTFTFGTANLSGNYICTQNTVTLSGTVATSTGAGTLSPAVLNLSGGTLGGSQLVTVLSQMNWSGGTMTGSGRTVIPPGVTLTINGGSVTLSGGRILENGGTIFWKAGTMTAASAAVITIRSGVLFLVQSSATIIPGLSGGRFDNGGTVRKSAAGTTSINSPISFSNYGAVELHRGILAANGGYVSKSNSLLHCALGGTAVDTGYGRLQVSGAVTLNGTLSVALTNGFVPAVTDSFTVVTAGTRNGAFASFSYPSNEVTMVLSNTATSVIVRVREVLVAPRPILLNPEFSGADLQLIWTTSSNTSYRLECNSDLNSTNWNALAGDVIGLSKTASKLDALTSSNRFYRVRVLP